MALIICKECQQKISNHAAVCPHCGFPVGSVGRQSTLSLSTTTNSNDVPGQEQHPEIKEPPSTAGKGLLMWVVIGGMAFILISLTGIVRVPGFEGEAALNHTLSPVSAGNKPTKAEWLSKLASRYGQYAQMRIVYSWKVSDFKAFMGQPDSTQTVGDQAFWYYECADGSIQLSMNAPNLSVGVMQGQINDY